MGRLNVVRTAAPTKKAANLVKGEPLHSFFYFNSRNFKLSTLSDGEKEKCKESVLLTYDEVGMAGRYELAKDLLMLKKFVGCKHDEECGVNILLCGALFQLTPSRSILEK